MRKIIEKKKEINLRVVKVVEEMCEVDIHEEDNSITNDERTRKTRLDLNSMLVSYSCKTTKKSVLFFCLRKCRHSNVCFLSIKETKRRKDSIRRSTARKVISNEQQFQCDDFKKNKNKTKSKYQIYLTEFCIAKH